MCNGKNKWLVAASMAMAFSILMACSDDPSEDGDVGVGESDAEVGENDVAASDADAEAVGELVAVNETIELDSLAPDDRTRSLSESLLLENVGDYPVTIENIDWVSQPNRVVAYHSGSISDTDADVTCDDAGDCSEGALCLTQSGFCRDIGFLPGPIEVAAGEVFTHPLAVRAGSESVDCPDSPGGSAYPDDYCGEILVESDGGDATVFITGDQSVSGILSLPDTFIEILSVEPGVEQTAEFEIENTGAGELQLQAMNISTNGQWFDVEPAIDGATVESGHTESFELEIAPPSEALEEDLEFQAQVVFESTSKVSEPMMTIMVTASDGD